MPLEKTSTSYGKHELERIYQGDILRDFTVVEWAHEELGEVITTERILAYSVILTQDCDLEQDVNNRVNEAAENEDKYLQSILICPAYQAEMLRNGKHIEDVTMQYQNGKLWSAIKSNNNYRYHYLSGEIDSQVPELVIDFKHYFTVPREVLYKAYSGHYLATIPVLFREDLSNRFCHYLSRIGLPNI
ncbi:MAG: hypothetical protein KAT25_07365 [Sulfuriflexus sp.]|nr:hypothetical protein [Sulfuriflexus sp.]